MLKHLINAISRGLSFSKTESRGTLVLIFIISMALIASKARISYLRNQPAIPADSITYEWIEKVASYHSKKESDKRLDKKNTASVHSKNVLKKNKSVKIASLSNPSNKKESVVLVKDLNFATAEELQSVKGIGPSFSKRIIKYRNLLGGFVDSTQLHEVYGLKPETIKNLLRNFNVQSKVTPIDINSDSINLLAKHPYVSFDVARIIINYRQQHGDIKSAEDLKNIKAIDDSTFLRLKPYLE